MLNYFQSRSFFKLLSSLVLPPEVNWTVKDGQYLTQKDIEAYKPKIKKLDFTHQSDILNYIWVCSDYHNSKINELLRRAKIAGEWKIANDFASIISYQYTKLIQPILDQNVNFGSLPKPDYIAFVPSDRHRFLLRGYHLPEIITIQLSYLLGIECLNLVTKIRATHSQTDLDRSARLANLKDCFQINLKIEDIKSGSVIWLIDDLTTTGTTIYEVAKVIKTYFPSVIIIGVVIAGN